VGEWKNDCVLPIKTKTHQRLAQSIFEQALYRGGSFPLVILVKMVSCKSSISFLVKSARYGLRWEIETLFGCLKGRGFNLEDTRVVGYLRMKKLFVLPVIAFCWSHKVVLVKSAR
jgi:hypothetical protein